MYTDRSRCVHSAVSRCVEGCAYTGVWLSVYKALHTGIAKVAVVILVQEKPTNFERCKYLRTKKILYSKFFSPNTVKFTATCQAIVVITTIMISPYIFI